MEHRIAHLQVVLRHAVDDAVEIYFLLLVFRQFAFEVFVALGQHVILLERDLEEGGAEEE